MLAQTSDSGLLKVVEHLPTVRNKVSTATLKGVRLLLSDWYEVYDYSPLLASEADYCGLRHTPDSSQGF